LLSLLQKVAPSEDGIAISSPASSVSFANWDGCINPTSSLHTKTYIGIIYRDIQKEMKIIAT
jgi:hypothetical protein